MVAVGGWGWFFFNSGNRWKLVCKNNYKLKIEKIWCWKNDSYAQRRFDA